MNDIDRYLQDNAPYSVGLAILNKLAPKHPLNGMLNRAENSFNRKKLREILSELKSVSSETQEESSKPTRYSNETIDSWPADIQDFYGEVITNYAEMNSLHSELRNLIYKSSGVPRKSYSNVKALSISLKILQLERQNRKLWIHIDYFHKNGTRINGEDAMSEHQKLVFWLRNQPQFISYCRQCESNGKTDKAMYIERKAILAEIEQYLKAHV